MVLTTIDKVNYCILIEISRRTIAFSYSREDGKNQFVPYGDELVKPLAIYSLGNELRIGKFAAEEARAGKVGAYDNIFDAIKKPASFTYRGTQYPLNKLLLFGIEQCLREFFDSILYGTEGQLEQNTAKVPICLLMSSELTDNEQAYVISLLRNAGYSNAISIDYNTMVLGHIRKDLAKNIEKAVFVSNAGNDLFIECIDAQNIQQPKRLFDLNAKDAGRNPQIDHIVKLIWQDIQFDENSINLVYNECLPELQKHAQNFLTSGELMCQNAILFNGHLYEYYLSRNSIVGRRHGIDNALDNLFLQLKSKGVEPTKSVIILLKSTANNAYVKQSFSEFFPSVIIFDEKKHQDMLNSILESVKNSNYILNNIAPSSAPCIADIVISSPYTQIQTTDIRAFNREWRVVKGTVSGFMRNRSTNEAKDVLEKFINEYDNLGIDLSEAKMLLEDVKRELQTSSHKEPKPHIEDSDEVDTGKSGPSPNDIKVWMREWRVARAEARGFLREGKKEQARTLLESFISNHKGMDNDEPRQMLSELKTNSSEKGNQGVGSIGSQHVTTSKQENPTEGEKLMKELRLKEAREWFTEHKMMKEAADCTNLIKASRQIKAYKAEIQSIRNNHNVQLAKSHLDDMKSWRAIYDNYNMDTKEIDDIIGNYKSIK